MRNFTLKVIALGILTFSLHSCKKDKSPEPTPKGKNQPVVLDCDYFNQDRVLVDDPDADVDYVIKCVMPVHADITIEPGVVIEFEQDAGIEVDDFNIPKASLSAIGTSAKPIIFRGVKKEKGYWRGIMFDSNNPSNKLIYTQVEDAGGRQFNSNGDVGAVHVYASGQLIMENSTISNSKSYGLNAVYSGSTLTLKNNKFTNNETPIIVGPQYINAINNTNDYKGNTKDFVIIHNYTSPISTPSTWHKINVPYSVPSTQVKGIGVKSLLTIEPGVVIEFGAETFLKISEDGGGLKAVGTASEPIIFTGISKVSKAWSGIYIDGKHPENEIAHAEFRYSGLGAPQANVWLWYRALLNIHDVKFSNITGCGINYRVLSSDGGPVNLTIGANIVVENGGCESAEW